MFKAPGDTPLFDLYLDQLNSEDAALLSTFPFDPWYGFDTANPAMEEAEA